ncbi:MAG: hypothetical protein M1835_001369 [Candelina submexicana]|nr:MAG: hypothetical protein M1835_001369 [Candelina submexicana]
MSPCWLLQLPRELRDMIYRYTLIQPKPIKVWSSRLEVRTRGDNPKQESYTPSRKTTLLSTCHQVNEEATSIMYGENTFEIDEYYSLSCITREHLQLVKKLWVTLFFSAATHLDESSSFVVEETMPSIKRRSGHLCAELKSLTDSHLQNLTIELCTHSTGFGRPHPPWIHIFSLPDDGIVDLWRSWVWGGSSMRHVVECFRALGADFFSIKGTVHVNKVMDEYLACSLTQMFEEGKISRDTFESAKCHKVWRGEDTHELIYDSSDAG